MNLDCSRIIAYAAQLDGVAAAESSRGVMHVLLQTLWLLILIAAPFVIFTLLIHFLERALQLRLASRFGWKSVLWTGWLGTPIHELSHVVMCVAFRHRVEEVALFEPDLKSGRLGYVRHSWTPKNTFEEIGNFFIGLAPLAGGSIALAGLLWLFYPDAASGMISSSPIEDAASAEGMPYLSATFSGVSSMLMQLLSPRNVLSWKFWLFTYLVLCVGSHMAPSRSDYEGASRGVLLVVGIAIAILLLVAMLGFETDQLIWSALELLRPIFALQIIAVVICVFATLIVHLMTAAFPERFRFA